MENYNIKKENNGVLIEENDLEGVSGGKSLTTSDKLAIGLGVTTGVALILAVALSVALGKTNKDKENKENELKVLQEGLKDNHSAGPTSAVGTLLEPREKYDQSRDSFENYCLANHIDPMERQRYSNI